MNFKIFIKILLVLGILDRLKIKKNNKKKNNEKKNNEKKNNEKINNPSNQKTKKPAYSIINYEYKRRDYTPQWKNCPECNKKINKVAKKCPYCNYVFKKGATDFKFKHNSIITKSVEKNGFSFNYPDYYDIASFESGNEIYRTMAGLSKNDGECEIYVLEYRISTFDKKAKRNPFLLMEYLKMQGYMNVSENRRLPYCFDAIANSGIGLIKTTILFKFRYNNVIMIVGNRLLDSDYDCMNDMITIYKSVSP